MLTDTEGVDFNDYLRRVYITVKQNWFAVMPASVQLGDQGVAEGRDDPPVESGGGGRVAGRREVVDVAGVDDSVGFCFAT